MLRFQLVIDCADPDKLARFWAEALGYVFEPPPEGFATWDDYWRDFGLGEDDLGRLHLDVSAGGGRSVPAAERKRRVDAEAQRLAALGATLTAAPISDDGLDHYGVAMTDPEGNEFDIA
jgi:hypothetical protein